MKSLGAASALGVGTQTVAAWGDTEFSQGDLEAAQELLDSVEEIESPFDTSFLRRGRNSDGFRALFSAIKADFENVQITDRTAYRVDKLGISIAQFRVAVQKTGDEGEIIIPVDNPGLSSDKQHNDVTIDPGAVVSGHSGDTPAEINRYVTGDQDAINTTDYAGVSKFTVTDTVCRVTIDLATAENEVQIQSDDATCSQCKLAMGAINASSCGLGTYLTCSVVTAKTVVGPVACAAVVPTICFIVQNYGTNDPDKTCAGKNPMGNRVIPDDLPTFC